MMDNFIPDIDVLVSALAGDEPEPFDHMTLEDTLAALQEVELRADLERAYSVQKRSAYRVRAGMNKEALSELLPELPPVGTDAYILANGINKTNWNAPGKQGSGVDFGAFLPYTIEQMGGPVDLHISTWSINHASAQQVVDLLDSGVVRSCTMLFGYDFHKLRPTVAYYLLSALRKHGGHYLAFRNHAKVMCVARADGSRCAVVTGSANFSNQPRLEQFVITTAPEVYDFFIVNLFEWAKARIEH